MDAELFIDSPISVIENENTSENGPNAKSVDDAAIDAKNGDSTITSKAIAQEQKCLDTTVKEQDAEKEKLLEDASSLNDAQFSKLDEPLTQAQLYSQSLLEKMDDITLSGVENQKEEPNNGKAKGRGSKRKASAQYNDKKVKRAVAAMLSRLQEGTSVEDAQLTEEEKAAMEQSELIPLLTGGQLTPYQLKGVKWLISLWKNGLNGILADQMGLGKTIQTIGFLAHLKGKGLEGPYMVIAPLSTLSNWVTEITRFVPSVKAIIYHGDMKKRKELRLFHMPKMGHRLKNSNCKLLRELKLFSIENKLLLTGTPLQNNLGELWSLLNFILPDRFSSREEFESWCWRGRYIPDVTALSTGLIYQESVGMK